jgi:hypothetical protein
MDWLKEFQQCNAAIPSKSSPVATQSAEYSAVTIPVYGPTVRGNPMDFDHILSSNLIGNESKVGAVRLQRRSMKVLA